MIQTIRVVAQQACDPKGEATRLEVNRLLGRDPGPVRTVKVYRLEGVDATAAQIVATRLLTDSVSELSTVNSLRVTGGSHVREVAYKPGVMNPEAASVVRAVRDLGYPDLVAADSSTEYHFLGDMTDTEVMLVLGRLLVNKTTQRVVTEEPETLLISGEPGRTNTVPIRELSDDALMALSKDKLFLNLEEMLVIRNYFRGLGRDPTDMELEVIAQTWSEHCCHKTFRARIKMDGVEHAPLIEQLMQASEGREDIVISSFDDNSGVMSFYDGWAICGKVETHNSPSAVEPYGGAATGSGGVFRDIMGTGQGARTILSTNVFCLAPWTLPQEHLPPGCLHPEYLLRNVVAGVRDYGNRMGVPTGNGSFHFHPGFRAKPSVIVGAYGLLPEQYAQKGVPRPGDLVIAVGGRTGRDGIHGATFSSAEMTARTHTVNAASVQIGNPIEQKRMADALLKCRDAGLIRAKTDCGAGGFSSAIGEMGKDTGVCVELKHALLKYSGLAPWEILLSESQERMVLAVAPEHGEEVQQICREHNVEATVLGVFTDDHRLIVTYDGETVCDLEMEFLHHGLPQRVMTATQTPRTYVQDDIPVPQDALEWVRCYRQVMAHLNICSRERVARQYDYGVQGGNAMPPYGGVHHDAPNDAIVLRPFPDQPYGMVVSHGLNPLLNLLDPYAGSLWAATEAMANFVAVGGNPAEAGLVDNFIWPFPDGESLGDLVMSVSACVLFAQVTRAPWMSGKDSLSSTYRFPDGSVLKIPPVLCVSVFGRIPDVAKTVSADFKAPGNAIVLVGKLLPEDMGGSAYYDVRGGNGGKVPLVDVPAFAERCQVLHQAITDGLVQACHDVSEGGIGVTLAEMAFGGDMGATICLGAIEPDSMARHRSDHQLFNEMAGCFLVEVRWDQVDQFLDQFENRALRARIIGTTTESDRIVVQQGVDDAENLFEISLTELKRAWQAPMEEVFS